MIDEDTSSGKYVVVFLLKGEIKTYHNQLVEKIATHCNIEKVSDVVDPHITLKYFNILLDSKKVKDLENSLETFCKNHEGPKLRLEGIGHFGDKVVFIDVKPSKEMKELYDNLVNELSKLNWIKWHEYEKENVHYHATLAEVKDSKKFDRILSYASEANPSFDLELDNISILTKPKDRWILHKEYKLGSKK